MPLFRRAPRKPSMAERLAGGISGSHMNGDAVVLPNSGAEVRVGVVNQDTTSITLGVTVDHPSWDRSVRDLASGIGSGPDEALEMAMGNIELNLVHLLDHRVGEAPDQRLTTTWVGAEHHWSVWLGNVITIAGPTNPPPQAQGEEYWHLLQGLLLSRLGNQKVTYIKVTAGLFGGKPNCEVQINDQASVELTAALTGYVQSTWSPQMMGMQKQFFWIVQDDATYQPYPHTAASIRQYVIGAGQIFGKLNQDDFPAQEYAYRLAQLTQDTWLSAEMQMLLPQIVFEQALESGLVMDTGDRRWEEAVPVSDALVIESGPVKYDMTYHQLACWAPLCEAVASAWRGELPDAVLGGWLAYSDLFTGVQQLLSEGATADVLSTQKPVQMTFGCGEGYRPR